MQERPKISVIIPVYNTEKYLEKCLDSILNNTLKDIEIICVDDGSTDNSLNILEKYSKLDNRLKIIKQPNSGAATARNTGIDVAKGDYFYFIDSDDYVQTSFLEKMYYQINSTHSDICLCKRTDFDELRNKYNIIKNALLTENLPSKVFNIDDINDKIFQFCSICIINKIFSRNLILSNDIKFQNLSSCNDVFFYFATLVHANQITYVDESLVTSVRCRKSSITSTRGTKINNIVIAGEYTKKYLDNLNIFNKVKDSFYKRLSYNFFYEINQCNNKKLKKEFNNKIKSFLPPKYLFIYKKYCFNQLLKAILNFIFSIRNTYKNNIKYKQITLLGIKINLKRDNK